MTPATGTYARTVGKRRMACEVEIRIDLDAVAAQMGHRACTQKSGKCVDGHVVVRKIGTPAEVSRELYPSEAQS